jgi:endonuclease/exonuclease/phosphatase family metal-dependent hydrolase
MNASTSLTLLSFNLWHGLNHNQPKLMLPAETWGEKQAREKSLLETFRNLIPEQGIFVAALQELNPIHRKLNLLSNTLNLSSAGAEGNVGLRLGQISYPFLLQEGLGFLWNSQLKTNPILDPQRFVLSGPCPDYKSPFLKIPLTFQLTERRVALMMSGTVGPFKVGFINTHLHHGNPKWKESGTRRENELNTLFEQSKNYFGDDHDFVFLMGDFNCYPGLKEYDLILQNGFEEISLDSNNKPIVSWDPFENMQCRHSVDMTQDPLIREWDNNKNAFDHIFIKKYSNSAKSSKIKTQSKRVFDTGPVWPSDHYGILCQVEIKEF